MPKRAAIPANLSSDVLALAALPRPAGVGDNHHAASRRHLVDRLTALGAQPYVGTELEAPYGAGTFHNIVARIPGARRDLDPVLLGAHYDSCAGTPGASDNAACVAVVLAVTERLLASPAERDVIVALFDAEEPPYFGYDKMGSTRFYEDRPQDTVRCAVILDLMGHAMPVPGAEDGLVVLGAESDSALLDAVRQTAVPDGLTVGATLNRYVGDMSDHGVFRAHGRPYLFLTEGFWPDYHEPTDTPDRLDFAKLAAEADYTEALLRRTARSAELGPVADAESLSLECESLERLIPAPVRDAFGVGDLTSREAVDRLVKRLVVAMTHARNPA